MALQDALPERLGPYRLLDRIGEGGMGVVYRAADPENRLVAVKVLRPNVAGDATARRRLAREVETMRRVRSPFVAEVVDADVTGDVPYIVTRYVPGRTLEQVVTEHPDRVFAFDEFGPLACAPVPGVCWAPKGKPARLRANYHKTAGVRQFHGCYSVADDRLWGVVRAQKGAANTLAALRTIRAARPDDEPIYVILDNLSAHKGSKIRAWAARHAVELDFTRPTPPGPTRSSRTSARCARSSWPAPTTPTTSRSSARCTRICAGATPTPATPTCSPQNAANEPASAASITAAGVNRERRPRHE